eukprot:gene4289-780_t
MGCAPSAGKSESKCAKCFQPVGDSQDVTVLGHLLWHDECFKCTHCGTLIGTAADAKADVGKVYHPNCLEMANAGASPPPPPPPSPHGSQAAPRRPEATRSVIERCNWGDFVFVPGFASSRFGPDNKTPCHLKCVGGGPACPPRASPARPPSEPPEFQLAPKRRLGCQILVPGAGVEEDDDGNEEEQFDLTREITRAVDGTDGDPLGDLLEELENQDTESTRKEETQQQIKGLAYRLAHLEMVFETVAEDLASPWLSQASHPAAEADSAVYQQSFETLEKRIATVRMAMHQKLDGSNNLPTRPRLSPRAMPMSLSFNVEDLEDEMNSSAAFVQPPSPGGDVIADATTVLQLQRRLKLGKQRSELGMTQDEDLTTTKQAKLMVTKLKTLAKASNNHARMNRALATLETSLAQLELARDKEFLDGGCVVCGNNVSKAEMAPQPPGGSRLCHRDGCFKCSLCKKPLIGGVRASWHQGSPSHPVCLQTELNQAAIKLGSMDSRIHELSTEADKLDTAMTNFDSGTMSGWKNTVEAMHLSLVEALADELAKAAGDSEGQAGLHEVRQKKAAEIVAACTEVAHSLDDFVQALRDQRPETQCSTKLLSTVGVSQFGRPATFLMGTVVSRQQILADLWAAVDSDGSGNLEFSEVSKPAITVLTICQASGTYVLSYNCGQERDADGSGRLDRSEFEAFYDDLTERVELVGLFHEYVPAGTASMTVQAFMHFLQKEQNDEFDYKTALGLVRLAGGSHGLTFRQFCSFIFDPRLNSMLKSDHSNIYQDMKHPLPCYFVATSHNTYLSGDQLTSDSSKDMYSKALLAGCRCVELDCWDGPDGTPIIVHKFTATSSIPFRDAIEEINKSAFVASPFPVILSCETHCTRPQQEKMVSILKEVCGESIPNPLKAGKELPSPHELSRKILVLFELKDKAEKQPMHEIAFFTGSTAKTPSNDKASLILSFAETKAQDFCKSQVHGPGMADMNRRVLTRIYPKGSRVTSSNLSPMDGWSIGCQLVAMNYQTKDFPRRLDDAFFKQNGGCGYVLKPGFTPSLGPCTLVRIEIISGSQLPKTKKPGKKGGPGSPKAPGSPRSLPKNSLLSPKNAFKSPFKSPLKSPMALAAQKLEDITDPYVMVLVSGAHDMSVPGKPTPVTHKTNAISDNGFNPVFHIKVHHPDLALVTLR